MEKARLPIEEDAEGDDPHVEGREDTGRGDGGWGEGARAEEEVWWKGLGLYSWGGARLRSTVLMESLTLEGFEDA
jgi:hypothetical protein